MNTIETEKALGLSFCERLELSFTHGEGTRVWDEAGRSYLDFTSGWGVTCLGHAHPVIREALARQGGRLMQSPNGGFTYSPERAALLRQLSAVLPDTLVRTFFCSSGAEANDAALKLARKITGRRKVVASRGAFHGRTYGALCVTRDAEYVSRYLGTPPGVRFVPHGDEAALAREVDDDTAAVIVEPVQGEGGVRIPHPLWLAEAQALCRRRGALLIVDEIQTGFCRTGRFFAVQHSPEPIEPHILTMGKGIGGGFPFAAFAVSASVARRLSRDDHGGTYAGNPLGCAVSHAVVRYLRENGVEGSVRNAGAGLLAGLAALGRRFPELIGEVRGLGLLCALEFRDENHGRQVTRRCAERGLLVVPTRGGIVRLLPDLLVSLEDIQTALEILGAALETLESSAAPHPPA